MSDWRAFWKVQPVPPAALAAQPHYNGVRVRSSAGSFLPNEYGYYAELLQAVEKQTGDRLDGAVLIAGSIAEGFGNPASDLDLLCIVDTAHHVAINRLLVFVEGRRIEVFKRRITDMRALAESVERWSPSDPQQLDAEALEQYQQFCNAVVLRDRPYLAPLRDLFSKSRAASLAESHHRHRALGMFDRALIAERLGRRDQALRYAKHGAMSSAKMLCARLGEDYLTEKFVQLQLHRSRADSELLHQLQTLIAARSDPQGSMLRLALDFAYACGLTAPGLAIEPPSYILSRAPGTDVHEISDRQYVFKEDRVFALDQHASDLSRSLGLLDESSSRIDAALQSVAAWELIGELHDHGLIGIGLAPERESWLCSGLVPADPLPLPCVAPTGPLLPAGAQHVFRLPFSARDFASAGADMNWAHVLIDNCREDIIGAYEVGHWSIIEHALRLEAELLTRILLIGWGLVPLPDWSDMTARLADLRGLDPSIVEKVHSLESYVVLCAEDADRGCALADEILASMPAEVRAEYLRGSHLDQQVYERARTLCYSWIELTRRLGVSSLIADVADIEAGLGETARRSA